MTRSTCAISGLKFATSYFDSLVIPHTEGYVHPIFACERVKLYPYYTDHCLGKLTTTDSYLLFLAFLHSSELVTWEYPASCNPQAQSTKALIEHNLTQLVAILEKTDLIQHPQFSQPKVKVYFDNSNLLQLPNWIVTWEDNIRDFYSKKADTIELEALQHLENKLTTHIYSSNPPEKYARVIADWACKAGDFPIQHAVLWKETIRSCFSITKMFNTPLPLLKEIKDYIECNIPVGSIHFTAVYDVIKEGIAKHEDYLGGSSLALGYTLLPSLDSTGKSTIAASQAELKGSAEVATIAANASERPPVRLDYPDTLSFLKAKLAYRVASNIRKNDRVSAKEPVVEVTPATASQSVLLVDSDVPLPSGFSELTEIEDELVFNSELSDTDLDGLTIIDNLDNNED